MIGGLRRICLHAASVRYLTTSAVNCLPYLPRDNPGVYRRLKVISENEPDIENAEIDFESMDQLEQDFMAEDMYDEATSVMKKISKKQEYNITERKHFKPPQEPSMLTWSEKEQIRHLHQEDPEKWSPAELASSFPASPAIIKKLLKSKWKPLTAERLKAHDQRVSENWKAFHKGKLEVHDPQLCRHLARFSDRKDGVRGITDEEAAKVTEVILPKPKRTEFLSLITSFNSDSKPVQSTIDVTPLEKRLEMNKQPFESMRQPDFISRSNTDYTLQQFRERLEEDAKKLSETPVEMKAIIKNKKPSEEEARKDVAASNSSLSTMYVAPSESFKVNAVVYKKSSKSPLSLADPDDLPNKITIPKEHWKEGKVYRVNDCFYNDRGTFLYRVPGFKP